MLPGLPEQISSCRKRIAFVRAWLNQARARGYETFEAEQALRLDGELLQKLEIQRLEELLFERETPR
jgi:hypothetical protein